jgi:glycosyltransferase involved in cell wall biosynthesis
VLLASYNGEQYIEQQIEIIVYQDTVKTGLLIRDDDSKDNTVEIIHNVILNFEYIDISLVQNKSDSHGHLKIFSALCSLALEREEQYFACSDQDDKWVQDKLLTLQKRIGELESKHGKDFPILIHSDLSVVDRNLNVISNSFIEYQGIPKPKEDDFPAFCYQNVATGCTMPFNKALNTFMCFNMCILKRVTNV